ncbi:lipopolysaccharide biosynthesis protein [Moritella viscosa]|uniref:Lsg n=1 Tax=Moritella viscosa TaxID=80854 RepID=A0A090IK42_9GAMM|nr:oligosaccharide flippase family protein [Moritella viscosa]CED61672.1 putative exopolysaccharide biosynthesis protein [Moritella viscosa]SGY90286.1 Lsg [Moritella viscosa]SGY98776.1 Lsg [Moritella viscosa]SGY99308.1 Lsg [Moritella viscosa]SHO05483.1 Lsg [Moritella viscosa]
MSPVFKNIFSYLFSSVFSAAIPFALLPILTRYLTPGEYGQIAMFSLLISALSALIGLSVHGASSRRFFELNVSENELARFNGNCVFILLVSTIATSITLYFSNDYLARYLSIPNYWVYFGVLTAFSSFLLNIRFVQWQIRGKTKAYGALQISNSILNVFLSLVFIILFNLGPEGRIYGISITSLLVLLVSFFLLRIDNLLIFEYNKKDVKYALEFGIPLVPHLLGGFLLLSIDRLVINKELGVEATGIYMVAVNLGLVVNVILSSVNKAYSPWLFSELNKNELSQKKKVVKISYLYFVFLLFFSALSFIIGPTILKFIVGEKFHSVADIVPIIILGQVFLGMYFIVTNYIFYAKKNKYLSMITISSGVLNIVLLVWLIPYLGIKGAAISFMIANLFQFVGTWIVSAKVFSMPWAVWKM